MSMEDDLRQEFEQALVEGRQPCCLSCHAPLVVHEYLLQRRVWQWNAQTGRYHQTIVDDGADGPMCQECDAQFEFAIGGSQLLRDLGLDD